jgi:transketolase
MRKTFIEELYNIAKNNKDIFLIVGDLGFGVVETFMNGLPDQFINVGVAEQNMTGLAAGIAMSGKIVITYSIGNFPIIRCLEQIRNDICYHDLPVIITSVGGGYAYGALGVSHHNTEDIAIMRALPNMAVIVPSDPLEAEYAVSALIEYKKPAYLRLGRDKEPIIHNNKIKFEIGKAIEISKGKDITIFSAGSILYNVLKAADALNLAGISAGVISMPSIKPIDKKTIIEASKRSKVTLVVEEHNIIGGLGSAIAEVLMDNDVRPRIFKRLGINDVYSKHVGDQEYLRFMSGLDSEGIYNTALGLMK